MYRCILYLALLLLVAGRSLGQSITKLNFNKDHLNKRLDGYVFELHTDLSLHQCVKECMTTFGCQSVNSQTSTNTCELNWVNLGDVGTGFLLVDKSWNYFEIDAWPREMVAKCHASKCPSTHRCVTGDTVPYCRPYQKPEVCDFEDASLCGYQQAVDDNFDWTRHTGSTASHNTGPSADHTYGTPTGHYLYIEATTWRQGDKARLVSKTYPASEYHCLIFWYHMYGSSIGTLNVYTSIFNNLGSAIWTLSGNKGNQWKKAQVTVKSPSQYEIVFEGQRGPDYEGDIAIDDVSVTPGACLSIGSCDFESQLCGYIQRRDDTFDWTLNKGSTPSANTGPSVDHTMRTTSGTYLYIESSSPRKQGDYAVIQSQEAPISPAYCFSFWYFMNGTGVGTLSIGYQLQNSADVHQLWSMAGEQGSIWKQGAVDINNTPSNFHVLVNASIGTNYRGDIAIDDLRLDPYPCNNVWP